MKLGILRQCRTLGVIAKFVKVKMHFKKLGYTYQFVIRMTKISLSEDDLYHS